MKTLSQHIKEGLFDVEGNAENAMFFNTLVSCLQYAENTDYWKARSRDHLSEFDIKLKGKTLYMEHRSDAKYCVNFPLGKFITCPDFPEEINQIVISGRGGISWQSTIDTQNKKSHVKKIQFDVEKGVFDITWLPEGTIVEIKGTLEQTMFGFAKGVTFICDNIRLTHRAVAGWYKDDWRGYVLKCENFYVSAGWDVKDKWNILDADDNVVAKNYSSRKRDVHMGRSLIPIGAINLRKSIEPGKRYKVEPVDSDISSEFERISREFCSRPMFKRIIFEGEDKVGEYEWVLSNNDSYLKRI